MKHDSSFTHYDRFAGVVRPNRVVVRTTFEEFDLLIFQRNDFLKQIKNGTLPLKFPQEVSADFVVTFVNHLQRKYGLSIDTIRNMMFVGARTEWAAQEIFERLFSGDEQFRMQGRIKVITSEDDLQSIQWPEGGFCISLSIPFNDVRRKGKDDGSANIFDDWVYALYHTSEIEMFYIPQKWMIMPASDMTKFRLWISNDSGLKSLTTFSPKLFQTVRGGTCLVVLDKTFKGIPLINGSPKNISKQANEFDFIEVSINDDLIKAIDDIRPKTNNQKLTPLRAGDWGIKNNDPRLSITRRKNDLPTMVSNKQLKEMGCSNVNRVYFPKSELNKITHIDSWKVAFPGSSGQGYNESMKGKYLIVSPGHVCSQSFKFFSVGTREEAKNLIAYLNLTEVDNLIRLLHRKPDLSRITFSCIPAIDLSKTPTSVQLTKLWGTTKDHVDLVRRLFE